MSIIIYTCPKCGGDLIEEVICTYPPIYVKHCTKCGWKEERMDEIVRIPYEKKDKKEKDLSKTYLVHCDSSISMACLNCPNHPSNGENGICNCTLGNMVTY